MASWNIVNIGRGNGFLRDATKPLPETMLIIISRISCQPPALQMLLRVITTMHLKITLLKSKPNPPGAIGFEVRTVLVSWLVIVFYMPLTMPPFVPPATRWSRLWTASFVTPTPVRWWSSSQWILYKTGCTSLTCGCQRQKAFLLGWPAMRSGHESSMYISSMTIRRQIKHELRLWVSLWCWYFLISSWCQNVLDNETAGLPTHCIGSPYARWCICILIRVSLYIV